MPRINQPEPGQVIWTIVNGQICQRVYVRADETYNGHVLGFTNAEGSYFEPHLYAYERESDILGIQLESARQQAEEAVARVPRAELAYRNALRDERDAAYAAAAAQAA